jgi:hypothetical protein
MYKRYTFLALILLMYVPCPLSSLLSLTHVNINNSLPKHVTPTPQNNVEVLSPANFPGVVTGFVIEASNLKLASPNFCIYLDQAIFWEEGDYWDSISDYPQIQIKLDGNLQEKVDFSATGPGIAEQSNSGELIGNHGGTFRFCLTSKTTTGRHKVAVINKTRSGKIISLSFEFVQD